MAPILEHPTVADFVTRLDHNLRGSELRLGWFVEELR
jgi:hypothetical protein